MLVKKYYKPTTYFESCKVLNCCKNSLSFLFTMPSLSIAKNLQFKKAQYGILDLLRNSLYCPITVCSYSLYNMMSYVSTKK